MLKSFKMKWKFFIQPIPKILKKRPMKRPSRILMKKILSNYLFILLKLKKILYNNQKNQFHNLYNY
jgi:hypothetical protein